MKVAQVHVQHEVKNLQGRSARLDILAVDEENRVYNIEIQRDDIKRCQQCGPGKNPAEDDTLRM